MSGDAGADAALRWGVPDWRDATAYPGSTTTLLEWWWQFTRRHPDYRALWVDAAPRQPAVVERTEERLRNAKWGAPMLGMPVDHYLDRKSDQAPLPDERLQARFRINCILNPTKSFGEGYLEDLVWHGGDKYSNYTITFNLRRPLEPQLREAKSLIVAHRNEFELPQVIHRPRKKNWALFLRALDAREVAETTFGEMTATFWPGQEKPEQAARDTYERARELREYFPL